MKILIADDNESNLLYVRTLLQKQGHEVVVCHDGNEVLQALRRGDLPQLLILDWMMPQATGPEICAAIRNHASLSYTHIILLTGKSERDDILEGLRSGADDYIMKPFDLTDFETRLRHAIRMIELNNLVAQQRVNLIAHAKMAVIGEMAAGVAHEISNPLSIISGHAARLGKLASTGPFVDPNFQRSLNSITLTVDRMAKVVNALCAFASEGPSEMPSTLTVGDLISESLLFCEAKFRSHGIRLDVALENADTQIVVQKSATCQAILNLLENAFLAVQGRKQKWIRIESTQDATNLSIAVCDSGCGIPEEIQEKIMTPFFTTRPIGKGSGLGLSIAKGIIEAQRGQLSLDQVSFHTRFVITIPCLPQNHLRQTCQTYFKSRGNDLNFEID